MEYAAISAALHHQMINLTIPGGEPCSGATKVRRGLIASIYPSILAQ